MTSRPLRRLPAALAALALAGVLIGTAGPVQAHDQLISSTPGSGEHFTNSPAEVTLTYSEDVLTIGALVLVTDMDGIDHVSGPVELTDSTVTAPLEAALPGGSYDLKWRVVSADGHPIAGVVPFTVGDGASAQAAAAAESTPTVEPTVVAAASSQAPPDVLRPVLIGLTGAVLAVAAFLLITRRRGRPSTTTEDRTSS
ncbi:copper resistance protein CopC [Rathayibacter sp. AY2B7]|uniref:copper resistance CopC family protein n=1 Tax=unclassified Rathayibacter TaxID=2609250 RepID=UPI000CE8E86A|nr:MULTISPECIES: copper resistance protein CopC [unclassified Rathayibacter]PPG01687.1 copper resistance protein CopC [Rathayibacter sp. AY2B1]PPG55545.1 copper resistance protein CopC [Rathayibacter sp. AY2B7]PPG66243.1 copper resistance protein CopC [Rathayibacter sp. AY1F4]